MCKYWKINGARQKDKLKHSEFVQFDALEKEISNNSESR